MGLTPENRAMLGELLMPPAGFSFDRAITTTYTLGLSALLTAPLSLAAADKSGDWSAVDPVQLLESVRRNAGRIVTYVEAAQIGVPKNHGPLFTFLEDQIVEVAPPHGAGIFHPKAWVVRFIDDGDTLHHRCLVLSRNLTFDRSWDVAVRLDETASPDGISSDSIQQLLRRLPGLAVRGSGHREAANDLADSLSGVHFAVPEPFREGRIHVLGWGDDRLDPLPRTYRGLAVSPFIDQEALDELTSKLFRDGHLYLVSRPETLDRLQLDDRVRPYVLDTLDAEAPEEAGLVTDHGQVAAELDGIDQGSATGLHAKFTIVDRKSGSITRIGSANLTAAATQRNVEIVVELVGSYTKVGVASTWGSPDHSAREALGLADVVLPYTPQPPGDEEDDDARQELEGLHSSLVRQPLPMVVSQETGETYRLTLQLENTDLPDGVRTTVAQLSLPGHQRDWAGEVVWERIAIEHVTSFLILRSELRGVVRSTVMLATLVGAPDRRRVAFDALLSDPAKLLRFLALLLDDRSHLAMGAALEEFHGHWGDGVSGVGEDVVLFEPVLQAAASGGDTLTRFVDGVGDLIAAGMDGLPDEVRQLYELARSVREPATGAETNRE